MKSLLRYIYIGMICVMSLSLVSCGTRIDEEEKEAVKETVTEVSDYGTLNLAELEVRGYDEDSEAMMFLGKAYEYGINGASQNLETAVSWYEKALEMGEPSAYLALGYFYLNGIVYDKDLDKALEYFEIADEAGLLESKVGQARVLIERDGLFDLQSMSSDLNESNDSENNEADNKDVEKNDAEKVFDLLLAANRSGSLDGAYWLGYAYENGIGTEVNYSKAMERYIHIISATNSDPAVAYAKNESNIALGIMFLKGLGVEVDNEVAMDYFLKASDNGYPKGSYYVGQMYENGIGVSRDYEKAMEYYMLACDKEFAPAYNQVGYMYFYGRGVEIDYASAVYYQKLAALQGFSQAQVNLGYMYENGFGVERDLNMAFDYYVQAAFKGYSGALEACQRVKEQIDESVSVEEE